jgi:hypothetical protein
MEKPIFSALSYAVSTFYTNLADGPLSASNGTTNVEQWAINKAVHYNEWANFGKKDFEPVVAAFKDLVAHFQCDTCQSFLYVSPRGRPEAVRCACNGINLNLAAKPK